MNGKIIPSGKVIHKIRDHGRWLAPRYGWKFRKMTACGLPVAEDGFKRVNRKATCKRCA